MKRQSTRAIFLKGMKTVLCPLSKESHLATITRWINDPEVRRFITVRYPAMTESEGRWLDERSKTEDFPSDIVLAVETTDGTFIGLMGLHRIDYLHRTSTTGALIGEKSYWGKGYGTDAKMALLDYAFNTLNLRKISSSVIAYNARSLHYSLRCGYKKEGLRRGQFFKDGEYHDEVVLGLFKEEWEAAHKQWLKGLKKKK